MPDVHELLEEWEEGGDTGLRPKRIQAVRGDLMEYTGIAVPHRVGHIESWLPRMKAQITRSLREAAEEAETDEQDEPVAGTTDDGADGGDEATDDSAPDSSDGGDSEESE